MITHIFFARGLIYSKLIDSQSLIVDLGANLGQFGPEIGREFNCRCCALQAVPSMYFEIK